MDFFNALSHCWWLGNDCIPDWTAWAAAAALFAGVGTWVAAAATYFAVIMPLKRRKLEDAASTTAAMEDFAYQLVELRSQLGADSFLVNMVSPYKEVERQTDMLRRMTHAVMVPAIAASPENLPLALALNNLKRSIRKWNAAVTNIDLDPDPELGSDLVDYQIQSLKSAHSILAESVRSVARLIKPMVPAYEEELDRILVIHDGFLVHPEEVKDV